jgi:molybdopterin-guanine dinucleotide biosynthesis protein A
VDSVIDRIDDIADSRKEARYAQVLKEPRADIEEAKAREYSPDWDMFINLNTMKDYETILKRICR